MDKKTTVYAVKAHKPEKLPRQSLHLTLENDLLNTDDIFLVTCSHRKRPLHQN